MTAETLRRAADQMRERAEKATQGRWETSSKALTHPGDGTNVYSDLEGPVVADCCGYQGGAGIEDGEHIASWHPAVALAVADWLDHDAEAWEQYEKQGQGLPFARRERSLAVARAYLGENESFRPERGAE